MRKLILLGICISFLLPTAMQAQYLRSSYFMEGSSTRIQLNPALQPKRGYVNLPGIGSVNAEVATNSLGIQDVIDVFDSDGEFYNNDKFYNRLKGMNEVNISANTDVISFGFYKGKGFWSFNVGARADVDATIPKTIFDYLRATDADNFSWSGESFDIRNEKLRLNAYIEVGAGYSRAINERLTVGGKAKLLLGAGNINLNINQLYMYGKDAGIDSEFQLKTDAYLEASAKGLDLEEENGYITDLDYNSFGISGYGAGIDLGASYQVMKNLTVSAAILDLGFISKINSYNTNQIFNAMAKNEKSAYEKFMSKVKAFRNGKKGAPANFDYLDAEGQVVLQTVGEEDNLAEGVEATLANGETSGTVVLEDGRVVTVEDNIVTSIEMGDTESLEDRVAALEAMLDEATNLIEEQENELRNLRGSNYRPKNRKTVLPGGKKSEPSAADLKNEAREKLQKVNAAKKILK